MFAVIAAMPMSRGVVDVLGGSPVRRISYRKGPAPWVPPTHPFALRAEKLRSFGNIEQGTIGAFRGVKVERVSTITGGTVLRQLVRLGRGFRDPLQGTCQSSPNHHIL